VFWLIRPGEDSGMAGHLCAEQVGLALRLGARGLTLREAGRQVGCADQQVHQLARGEPAAGAAAVWLAAGSGLAGAG
jgi:hypothetical protein